ncbi:MAG: hypothetical protein A3K67_02290 [Euryarchaeota archaeon RBG_16_62_10]|nr:MAG: hypothetical protein A3K67_02290 [Euryarchaeota archaeon RBG_16_62_10]
MAGPAGTGRVHVITGPGRGKTTSAFGLAMRAAGHGLRVCVVQFMKTGETTGEVLSARKLGDITVEQFGTGRFVGPEGPSEDDRRCASDGLARAKDMLRSGECRLLILDEVNVAVHVGLLKASEVLAVVDLAPEGVEIVLTGRDAPREFLERADYVSVIESLKHPFDQGLEARKGIEW